jgi:UDP-N-acetylglucosamine 2-epimerase
MSAVFFEEMGIPTPDVNLNVGSGPHGAQTGQMLKAIERVLLEERPDCVLVYGDTNSTLAGALASVKLGIRVGHVEAGLRSFNRAMPEEINRVLTDHAADILLCPSETARRNLAAEGVTRNVYVVGDVMGDALAFATGQARCRSDALQRLNVRPGQYLLATVHRPQNTDDPGRLRGILSAFDRLSEEVIFPVHPRTRSAIASLGYLPAPHVHMVEPVGYLDMVALEQSSRMILTDSGGIQKEAYWLGIRCVTLRDETEWIETVALGWNRLVGSDSDRIVDAVRSFVPPSSRPQLYGGHEAAERCVAALSQGIH